MKKVKGFIAIVIIISFLLPARQVFADVTVNWAEVYYNQAVGVREEETATIHFQADDNIGIITGEISYNSDYINLIAVEPIGWKMTYNPNNGRFQAVKSTGAYSDSIAKIRYKVIKACPGSDVLITVSNLVYTSTSLITCREGNSIPLVIWTDHCAEHAYGEEKVITPASCTEDGQSEKVCVDCGEAVTEVIPATGHSPVIDEAVSPTCTETGLTEGSHCDVCGQTLTEQETVPAAGHTWKEEYTVDRKATCTEEGSESIHCAVCDAVKAGSPRSISKLDHAYGDWETVTEPTCIKEGSRKKVCAECGGAVIETIPATGHTWNESYTVDTPATCKLEGVESIHCSICGEKQEGSDRIIPRSSDHRYGEWHTIKEIAGSQDGIKERVCEICGDIEQETISSPYGNVDLKDAVEIREGTTPVAFLTSLENDDAWDQIRWYKFTPDKTAAYIFTLTNALYLQSDNDTFLQLFGSYEDAENDTDYIYEDVEGHHDRVVLDSKLNAGQTYYLYLFISSDYKWDTEYNMNLTISKKRITDISEATVTGISNKTYTGLALMQNPTVKVGDKTLTKNTDYSVTYSNNTNAGIATVTITGKGNYTGTKTATFIINKANQSITAKASASSIAVGKTATVSITGAKGTKSFKSSDPSVATVNTSSGVVTGKKAGTVTITATSAATSNYNAASKTVQITVTADKTLKRPGSCRFTKWNNKKFTSCRISWNKVAGAEGYQTLLSWTNGSHASSTIVKANVLYRDCTVANNHVSQMKVRAFYTSNGKRVYGPWSNVEYITPSPSKITAQNVSKGNDLKMKVNWKPVYGCNGYNVFVTTNPNGKWSWNQSTSVKATATSAAITKCGGKLKKNTRYYVRIVTRRKRNGVFCTVPMPSANTYTGSFIIK